MNTELDKTKLVQSKKASERKAVKKAYEEVDSNCSNVFVVFVCLELESNIFEFKPIFYDICLLRKQMKMFVK